MRICSMFLSSIALAAVAAGAGCLGTSDAPAEDQPLTSGIQIPLVQQINGAQYRLDAQFQITNPDGTTQIVDGTGNDSSVTVQVSPGIVGIRILDGWTLSRSTDGGMTFTKVEAVLGTMTQVNLVVLPNQVATWQFDFILRETGVELHITFGVVERPHQLTGLLFVSEGFGRFAPYRFTELTFAIYFDAFSFTTIEADGTHTREYFSSTTSLEFFGDTLGQLTPLAADFSGGFLDYKVRLHPDGTQDSSGNLQAFGGSSPEILFDVGQTSGSVDQDGFPADAPFFMFNAPFQISSNFTVDLTGSVDDLQHSIRDSGGGGGGGGGMGM
ncbi:MAG TPA: hypothetical protein VFT22_08615 [Kofleriaceae bacterium]|nr:hypothetical protein [Kofleriaceae bacterium]